MGIVMPKLGICNMVGIWFKAKEFLGNPLQEFRFLTENLRARIQGLNLGAKEINRGDARALPKLSAFADITEGRVRF